MTNQELVQTYVALTIIQYADPNNQPRALATVSLMANEAIADQVVGQVSSGFSLTSLYGQSIAQGTQLNTLAQFVGAQRVLPNYLPSGSFYGFQNTAGAYDPSIGGMGDTTLGTQPLDFFASVNTVEGTYILSDGQMIQLIQYLAAVNNAYLSVSEIDAILYSFFGPFVTVEETSVMQITYTDSLSDPNPNFFGIVKYLNAFPHPAGVDVQAEEA